MAKVFARLRWPSIIAFSIYLAFEAAEAPIVPDDSLFRDTLDGIRDVLLVPGFTPDDDRLNAAV